MNSYNISFNDQHFKLMSAVSYFLNQCWHLTFSNMYKTKFDWINFLFIVKQILLYFRGSLVTKILIENLVISLTLESTIRNPGEKNRFYSTREALFVCITRNQVVIWDYIYLYKEKPCLCTIRSNRLTIIMYYKTRFILLMKERIHTYVYYLIGRFCEC